MKPKTSMQVKTLGRKSAAERAKEIRSASHYSEALKGSVFDCEDIPGYKAFWAINRVDPSGKTKYNRHSVVALERTGWEKVVDDKGTPLTVDGGRGDTHFLMILPMEIWQEREDIRQAATLESTQKQAADVSIGAAGVQGFIPDTEGFVN